MVANRELKCYKIPWQNTKLFKKVYHKILSFLSKILINFIQICMMLECRLTEIMYKYDSKDLLRSFTFKMFILNL